MSPDPRCMTCQPVEITGTGPEPVQRRALPGVETPVDPIHSAPVRVNPDPAPGLSMHVLDDLSMLPVRQGA